MTIKAVKTFAFTAVEILIPRPYISVKGRSLLAGRRYNVVSSLKHVR